MVRRMLFFAAFVAVALFTLGGNVNAARREKVPQSPCAFMQDIDKRVEVPFLEGDCVLCRCVLKGVEQDIFRIRYEWSSSSLLDGDCDDSDGQIEVAIVSATRWVRVEKDTLNGTQVVCVRGKEDVSITLFVGELSPTLEVFTGKGVGVVGVGNPLKGELCCNFEENQAVLHLKGIGHNSFGGPAPKKKCWARVKYISRINPSDPTDPCSIFPIDERFPAQFVINGVEGCICDSSVDVPQGG